MTADGVWTYTLDDDNSAVQALNVGDKLTDTFTVTTDRWHSAGGDDHHQRHERRGHHLRQHDRLGDRGRLRGPGKPAATGTLTGTDVDNASNTFTPVECQESDGGYGTFTMTADGAWTYTLDNDNRAVQALNDCGTLTDTFTVTTADGTEQVVTIIIAGKNDAAIISGTTTGSVVEAACQDPGDPAATAP